MLYCVVWFYWGARGQSPKVWYLSLDRSPWDFVIQDNTCPRVAYERTWKPDMYVPRQTEVTRNLIIVQKTWLNLEWMIIGWIEKFYQSDLALIQIRPTHSHFQGESISHTCLKYHQCRLHTTTSPQGVYWELVQVWGSCQLCILHKWSYH